MSSLVLGSEAEFKVRSMFVSDQLAPKDREKIVNSGRIPQAIIDKLESILDLAFPKFAEGLAKCSDSTVSSVFSYTDEAVDEMNPFDAMFKKVYPVEEESTQVQVQNEEPEGHNSLANTMQEMDQIFKGIALISIMDFAREGLKKLIPIYPIRPDEVPFIINETFCVIFPMNLSDSEGIDTKCELCPETMKDGPALKILNLASRKVIAFSGSNLHHLLGHHAYGNLDPIELAEVLDVL